MSDPEEKMDLSRVLSDCGDYVPGDIPARIVFKTDESEALEEIVRVQSDGSIVFPPHAIERPGTIELLEMAIAAARSRQISREVDDLRGKLARAEAVATVAEDCQWAPEYDTAGDHIGDVCPSCGCRSEVGHLKRCKLALALAAWREGR